MEIFRAGVATPSRFVWLRVGGGLVSFDPLASKTKWADGRRLVTCSSARDKIH